jgi:hypothetical protein
MKPIYENADEEYAAIAVLFNVTLPPGHVDDLRRLADAEHVDSMNLLAVVLGDLDSKTHRDEIIRLFERAHELGSQIAAYNLAIQYRQWGEPLFSKIWMGKSRDKD